GPCLCTDGGRCDRGGGGGRPPPARPGTGRRLAIAFPARPVEPGRAVVLADPVAHGGTGLGAGRVCGGGPPVARVQPLGLCRNRAAPGTVRPEPLWSSTLPVVSVSPRQPHQLAVGLVGD